MSVIDKSYIQITNSINDHFKNLTVNLKNNILNKDNKFIDTLVDFYMISDKVVVLKE